MSLRIWLPLNGDLRNNGLDDVTVTNNGATVDSSGKLGSCYYFDGNDDYINLGNIGHYFDGSPFSITFWIKSEEDGTRGIIFSAYGLNSTSNFFSLEINGSSGTLDNYLRFDWLNADIKFFQGAVTPNTWLHFAVVYNGTKVICYKNGELYGDKTCTLSPIPTGNNYYLGRDSRTGATAFKGRLNDFRLYDHALSLKEVKEISKGLILHYLLADKYIENTTNLITTEDCLSTTCYNGAISKYSYGTNTDMYKEVTTFQGKKGTKVYNQTNGTGMYPYVYINNMYTSDGTNSPAYKTLSFDYYTTISTSICPYKLGSGNGTATYIVTNNETQTGTGTNQVVIPVKPNMWNHIEVTFHGTTEADAQWGYIQNQPSHTSDTSNFWFFANMQLEEKDHATGYVGIGGSRTVNTIYDTSGFENNGIKVGSFSYDSDTPKYNVSTYMPKESIITHPRCLDNTNQEWSCAAWVKPTVAGNYQNLNNFNEANRLYHGTYPLLYVNSGTNDYYNYGNLALPANQWSHIVFVFKNSDGTKLVYINGENHTNTGGPNKTSIPKGIPDTIIIGGSYEGGLCDYREYATALSAEDVKNLYQITASVDKNNNYYSYSYNELTQNREIEYMYNLVKSSGSGVFTQNKDGLNLNNNIWVYHDYIPINPTGKTYKYDIIYSCDVGNQFYIGWERYDANKTSRSNNACVYVVATKPSEDRIKYRIRGIVDLSNDGVNPCAFIKLRILNMWTGSDSDTNGTATIHYLSLKEYTDTTTQDMTPLNINKQGIVNTTEILEKDIGVSVSNVYELNSHNFYEY